MEKNNNEVTILDPEDYSGGFGKELSFQQIIFAHLSKISKICTSEFAGGYWTEKTVNVGSGTQVVRTYIEDKRDAYNNAVDYLHDLLLPSFDFKMIEKAKEINKAVDESYNLLIKKQEENGQSMKSQWVQIKLKSHRKMFQQLSGLLTRKDYFSSGSTWQKIEEKK